VKKYALSELVLDFDIYPRGDVDSHHVGEIASAMEAGASMPPLVIDRKSKRIADGFHRWRAYRRLYDDTHKVDCIEKDYKNDKELFLDSMRYNASHGRALTQHDKVHCLLLAEKLKVSSELVAQALNITPVRIGELRAARVGTIGARQIALKQTIRHMGGKELTEDQGHANEKLSGMSQLFYVNQLVTLIENDLIDLDNADLIAGLAKLHGMLGRFVKRNAA
jgi:ParB-like chromosome segregation protein Spo0J